jgi:hypothetical protein
MIPNFARCGGDIYFTDSYHFNIAACNMAERLGVDDRIPVTIEREYRGSFSELM